MKVFIAALFALVLVSQAIELRHSEFMNWRLAHGKFYADAEEHAYRLKVFSSNMDYVDSFNAARKSENDMYLGSTRFADMSHEEFKKTILMPKGTASLAERAQSEVYTATGASLPDSVDWRTKGAVTDVKDQGQCGSCWSFGTTGAIEGSWKLAGNDLVSLSEQNLMDCTWSNGNMGCNGGMPDRAMAWVKKKGGIDTEESYPYTAKSSFSCKFDESNIGASISDHIAVDQSEDALQEATANIGPISIAIDASHMSFQLYKGGIYREPSCKNGDYDLDHAVLIVGYGSESDGDFWIVKNSWAATWGDHGYIKMARNENNQCGVATSAVYAKI